MDTDLKVNIRLIAVATLASLLFAAVVVGISLYQTPVYEASAKVAVDVRSRECSRTESGAEAKICLIPLAPATPPARIAQMTVRIGSRSVAKESIRHLNLRMSPGHLLDNLRVQYKDALFIGFLYTDTDPKRAKEVVGTVSRIAAERINRKPFPPEKLPPDTELTAAVWIPAKMPTTPVSPKSVRNGLIALVSSLVLSVGLIAGRGEYWRRERGS